MTANKHTPMVVAAARALCRRDSDLCNVDFDDNWKLYGDGFLMDAQVALESVAAPELLEAANLIRAALQKHGEWDDGCFYFGGKSASELQSPIAALTAAIAKATGGAA